MTDYISRADAIKTVNSLDKSDGCGISAIACYTIDSVIEALKALPSAEAVDCTDFIKWLVDRVLDETIWEYNSVAYGEIICRKLEKLGVLEVTEEPCYYIRPSADAVPYCSTREVSWSEPRTWHEKNSHTYICGDCGFEQAIYGNINEYNCCPRCGVYKEYVDYGGIFPQKRTPYREESEVEK